MRVSPLNNSFLARLFGKLWARPEPVDGQPRAPKNLAILLDGTMSSLDERHETNVGLTYKLCREMGAAVSVYYEPGLQWRDWRSARDVASGRGINRQIRRAYGFLASRYRPGDRIFLMGYSRGAYAVRSLAGLIDRMGLLKAEHATERNIRLAYRHYECSHTSDAARAFKAAHCVPDVQIEMIGVWDTVKSLGVNAPVLWRLSAARHAFHNHELGSIVRNGFHALAMDETRVVFKPVLWRTKDDWAGRVEQMWFPGTHGDVGGQLSGEFAARPLSNIPLVWMLKNAQSLGLPLPEHWKERFPQDAKAPSVGTWRGFGKIFVTRRKRVIGADPSEKIHISNRMRHSTLPAGAYLRLKRMTRNTLNEAQKLAQGHLSRRADTASLPFEPSAQVKREHPSI